MLTPGGPTIQRDSPGPAGNPQPPDHTGPPHPATDNGALTVDPGLHETTQDYKSTTTSPVNIDGDAARDGSLHTCCTTSKGVEDDKTTAQDAIRSDPKTTTTTAHLSKKIQEREDFEKDGKSHIYESQVEERRIDDNYTQGGVRHPTHDYNPSGEAIVDPSTTTTTQHPHGLGRHTTSRIMG